MSDRPRLDVYKLFPEAGRAMYAFEQEEVARLVFVLVTINSWNRRNLTARLPVGDDVSRVGG